jgi:hypothetical protein
MTNAGDFKFMYIEDEKKRHIIVNIEGELFKFVPESLLKKEREKAYKAGAKYMHELWKQPLTWSDFKKYGIVPYLKKIKKLFDN